MSLAAKYAQSPAFDAKAFLTFLVNEAKLSPGQATHYEKLARLWNSPQLDVLYGANAFEEAELARLVAQFTGLKWVDLVQSSPDFELFEASERDQYLKLKVIPFVREQGQTELLCAIPSTEIHAWAHRKYGPQYRLSISAPAEIVTQIQHTFRDSLDHSAREKLYELQPSDSAKLTLTPGQKIFLFTAPVLLAGALWFNFTLTLFAVSVAVNCYYAFTLLFRMLLTFVGGSPIKETEVSRADLAALDERELPTYTVMVAMYKEAAVLPLLTQNLRELDYPRSKLEIKIILEEDDTETLEVARKLHLENFFEFIVVPHSLPKTKPKALNYALPFVKGDYLTIYDAEDRPDPQQLKKAYVVFKRLKNISCVQARLSYFNSDENFLTRMFTIEYSQWFDVFLLGLYRLNIPIPLGGTSNHFRTEVLKSLGGWDPYNVTEDADLGLRMEKNGHRVAIVNSTTFEEANTRLGNWIRQRSRWLKGHMQTFLIHMRNPVKLFREIGPVGFFGFMFFIGGPCFVALMNPLLWGLLLGTTLVSPEFFARHFPAQLLDLAFFNLVFGNIIFIILGAGAVADRSNWKLVGWSLGLPIYWILQSVAAYKALWQLMLKPHFWEKTTHGLSTHMQPQVAESREKLAQAKTSRATRLLSLFKKKES